MIELCGVQARARGRHEQQELFTKTGDRPRSPRGGKRTGAGRPPKGKRAGSPHKARPVLKGRFPVHVVLRVVDEMKSLRKRHMYKAIREATISGASRMRSLPPSSLRQRRACPPD